MRDKAHSLMAARVGWIKTVVQKNAILWGHLSPGCGASVSSIDVLNFSWVQRVSTPEILSQQQLTVHQTFGQFSNFKFAKNCWEKTHIRMGMY